MYVYICPSAAYHKTATSFYFCEIQPTLSDCAQIVSTKNEAC